VGWGADSPTRFEDRWQFGNFRNRLYEKREKKHAAVNRQEFMKSSLDQLVQHLNEDSPSRECSIGGCLGHRLRGPATIRKRTGQTWLPNSVRSGIPPTVSRRTVTSTTSPGSALWVSINRSRQRSSTAFQRSRVLESETLFGSYPSWKSVSNGCRTSSKTTTQVCAVRRNLLQSILKLCGNGCILHQVQTENEADPRGTPFVNDHPGSLRNPLKMIFMSNQRD
jgi:hypothetical protein